MPQWVAQPELDDRTDVPAGTVVEETLTSKALGATRRVWFYTPPGYEKNQDWYPVVFVLDGGNYVERMRTPAILDRLIAAKTISRCWRCSWNPANARRSTRAIHGGGPSWPRSSCRSWTSASARSRLRRNAWSLAVRFQLTARSILRSSIRRCSDCARRLPRRPRRPRSSPIRPRGATPSGRCSFFVLAGTYDAMAIGGRKLRTALDMGGTGAVTYVEVPEGHSTETFRGHLDDAFKALLPPVS